MKVVLHIGMSKAGSTAIQHCVMQRKAALHASGVCYAKTGRSRGAHYGVLQALKRGEGRAEIAGALREAEQAGAHTLLLSAEGFWMLPAPAVQTLADAFAGHDVEVVLYLRRPDTYLTSSYRQRIKMKRGTKGEHAYVQEPHVHLRYDQVLERWGRHFPLRVRAYEAVRSDLVGDFARAIGAADVLDCPAQQRANVTPSDGSLRLMRLANRIVSSDARGMSINRRLLAWQRAFAWMPPLDDAPLVARARAEAAAWDRDVMARHLSPEDLAAITPPA